MHSSERRNRGDDDGRSDCVRLRCTADARALDLDVSWTKGAIFEFSSLDRARRWVADQNVLVPGTLFIAEAPVGDGAIEVDYYVKYQRPDR